jgi:hypothetical protein
MNVGDTLVEGRLVFHLQCRSSYLTKILDGGDEIGIEYYDPLEAKGWTQSYLKIYGA